MTKDSNQEIGFGEAALIIGTGAVALGLALCAIFPDEVKAALGGALTGLGLETLADVAVHKTQEASSLRHYS